MPQQINLCTPVHISQKQGFSAVTMAQALLVFLVFGGLLCGAWVWNLNKTSAGFTQTIESQAHDIEKLKAALETARSDAAPLGPAMVAQLQTRRAELARKEQLRLAMLEGLAQPGMGHSDRLALVAQSIPQPAWITGVKADSTHFEMNGFTLEPAVLNEWVTRLAASPLLRGLKLATVRVESANAPPGVGARQIWSFNLVSEPANSAITDTPGSKP